MKQKELQPGPAYFYAPYIPSCFVGTNKKDTNLLKFSNAVIKIIRQEKRFPNKKEWDEIRDEIRPLNKQDFLKNPFEFEELSGWDDFLEAKQTKQENFLTEYYNNWDNINDYNSVQNSALNPDVFEPILKTSKEKFLPSACNFLHQK